MMPKPGSKKLKSVASQRAPKASLRFLFQALYTELNGQFIEREAVLKGCILALLAKKHVFQLGTPGTSKSKMTEEVCLAFENARYFERQIDKFTKPEDLYGPLKFTMLKNNIYERDTEGMFPEAHIAFIDEIWKAGGSILDTMLKLMDESRRFYNGKQKITTPLMSVIGASNELPENDGLRALYDRFLLRYVVGDIVDDENFEKMLSVKIDGAPGSVAYDDLTAAQAEVSNVGTKAVDALLRTLRTKLKPDGFTFSPRRWKESKRILQAHAWFEGRTEVTADDLEIMENILWDKPEDRRQVIKVILSMTNPDLRRAMELLDQAKEVHDNALKTKQESSDDTKIIAQGSEAGAKLRRVLSDLRTMKRTRKIEESIAKVEVMQREVLRECLGVET